MMMDGSKEGRKEIGLRITEQEGRKRPRNGAGKIDFDREEQRGRLNRTGG